MNRFYNPVRTCQGVDSLACLESIIAECKAEKILLLVWSQTVLENKHICQTIENYGREKFIVKEFIYSNPELEQLYQVYEETKAEKPDLVVAVGGGSVLDVGKSLCCLFGEQELTLAEMTELIRNKAYKTPSCKWIGVPTTAGTGSEVTCWATIWDSKNNVKYSIDTQENYAYAAVVDPVLADSMPVQLSVSSALDAVAHAVESYWAKASNTVSRQFALGAISTIMEHIDELIQGKPQAHDYMAQGSMMAGLAFSNTRTTACHSISYPLTMKYHIPHGVAVSMLIAPVMKLNLPLIEDKERLFAAFGVADVDALSVRINTILAAAGIKHTLQEWGAQKEDFADLIKHSITKGRADNNPAEITPAVVENILTEIY